MEEADSCASTAQLVKCLGEALVLLETGRIYIRSDVLGHPVLLSPRKWARVFNILNQELIQKCSMNRNEFTSWRRGPDDGPRQRFRALQNQERYNLHRQAALKV